MTNKIDTDALKSQHNIVDYINTYVHLKKAGANYMACCPFHNEKTPSFSVSESKQMYYCFGCGATGDVLKFAMEYGRVDFIEACKMLGADVALMSDEQITKNRNRIISHLPTYDKRAPDKCAELLKSDDYDETFTALITDLETGEIVNIFDMPTGEFIACGVSHLAGTQLTFNESKNFVICTDYFQGQSVHNQLNVNVLVAYSAMNIKLIFDSESQKDTGLRLMPLITLDDTHAHNLTGSRNWIYAEDYKTKQFTKMKKGDDIEKFM